eukprot:Phypoly_transcript_12843.p1 GENE.Phypoly_transcript_12843~~Phypoly_transcript_12843.p1  ORF type:complete len:313 (+),score=50.83 Phypoly_transcript_12843:111-1049(+)
MVNILVIGASGYIGEPLAIELRRQGHNVHGLVRSIEKAKELLKHEVQVVVGDGTKTNTLVDAIKKVDVIINSSLDFTNPHTDIQSVEAISSAIEKAGGNKKRFIFVSGILCNEPGDNITEESPNVSDEFLNKIATEAPLFESLLRNRLEAEKRVLTAKNYSGVVARGSIIYGRSKAHWTIHFQNADEGKVVVYGNPNALIAFLHVDDFVDGLVKATLAENSKVEGQLFIFAETNKITQKEVAYAWAKGAGKEPKDLKEEASAIPIPLIGRGNFWVDPTKASRVLGWTAVHHLANDAQVLYESWKAYGTPGQW